MDVPDQSQTSFEELDPFLHTDAPNLSSPQKTLAGWPLWHYHLPSHYQDLLPDGPALSHTRINSTTSSHLTCLWLDAHRHQSFWIASWISRPTILWSQFYSSFWRCVQLLQGLNTSEPVITPSLTLPSSSSLAIWEYVDLPADGLDDDRK